MFGKKKKLKIHVTKYLRYYQETHIKPQPSVPFCCNVSAQINTYMLLHFSYIAYFHSITSISRGALFPFLGIKGNKLSKFVSLWNKKRDR